MASGAIVLVGIDVGMTCTGVAWALKNKSMQMTDPHVIQKWPGNAGTQSDKVPTVVAYTNGRLSSWGFLTSQAHEDPDYPSDAHDWFKVYFDPEEYNRARLMGAENLPSSHAEVRRWYRDFLQKLNAEIEKQLEGRIGSAWSRATVEFLFSVPTTWTAINIINDFENLIREAGFGSGGPNHTCTISLTEAEAAAVHTFKAGAIGYSDGDIILIVDAGGGTTDLALLRADVKEGQRPKLQELDKVRGDEIGSVLIDMSFEELAKQRLMRIAPRLRRQAHEVAWDMMKTSFTPFKVEFGTEHSTYQNIKLMKVPGLGDDFDAPDAGIRSGKMRFTNADLQSLFDIQVAKIFALIDHQLSRVGQVARNGQVTHMILSGGLGSSEYLKQKLKERYVSTPSPNPFARHMMIVTSDAPQLAVVKGLVQDRIQKLGTGLAAAGSGVLESRICRMSLGIVCSQRYDPIKHRGQQISTDPVDGKKYVRQRIDWFIKQGDSVSETPIAHKFYRTLPKTTIANREPWLSEVVISYELKYLPGSMLEDGVKKLCQVKSNLTNVPLEDFEKKKRSWWKFWKSGQTHYFAIYEIRFRMKPAGVEFELWFKGQKFTNDYVKIDWAEGAAVSSPKEHRRASLDRMW